MNKSEYLLRSGFCDELNKEGLLTDGSLILVYFSSLYHFLDDLYNYYHFFMIVGPQLFIQAPLLPICSQI